MALALSILFLLVVLVAVYVLVLRPVLVQRGWLPAFYDQTNGFWGKVALYLQGWKTIVAARLVWLGGLAVAAHDAVLPWLTGVDWTPLTSLVLGHVPPELRVLAVSLLIAGLGALFEWLRHRTNGPVGDKGLDGPGEGV